jgi:hypothetical protein
VEPTSWVQSDRPPVQYKTIRLALPKASRLRCLSEDRPLLQKVGVAGRQSVLENFTFTRMVDEFEAVLKQINGNGYYA